MTVAPKSVKSLAARGRTTHISGLGALLRRWERVLVVLAVCLPVPILAATGLSIPLPATVERLAAALVPWAGAARLEADESLIVGADGAIVLAHHELAEVQAGEQPMFFGHATTDDSNGGTPQGKDDGSKGGGTSGENDGTSSGPADGGAAGEGSGGGGSGGSGSGGGGSTDEDSGSGGSGSGGSGSGGSGSGGSGSGGSGGNADPVQGVVDQAGSATQPVVDVVEDTVDDSAGTVGGVVEDAGEVVGGVLPVAGGVLPVGGP